MNKERQILIKNLNDLEHMDLSEIDTILLEGGKTYTGFIHLRDIRHPLLIQSVGPYPATIESGFTFGISLYRCENITVSRISLKGLGWSYGDIAGLHMGSCKNIRLHSLEVCGYSSSGINIYNGENIEVYGCYVHDNGRAGIVCYQPKNRNIYIGYCKVHNSAGSLVYYTNHCGSGINLTDVEDAVVEYCEVAGSGWAQRQIKENGPVGIWCFAPGDRVVFRHCISRYNRTQPGTDDGGGFDFDSDIRDSSMEYNYSYCNDGGGYLFCEYDSTGIWNNNFTKYCVSINDASRGPRHGSLVIYAFDGTKMTKGTMSNMLVVPSEGRKSVCNKHLDETSNNLSVRDSIFIADNNDILETENPNLSLENNITIADRNLRLSINKNFPTISDPRALRNFSIFKELENPSVCAELLQKKNISKLYRKVHRIPKIQGVTLFTLLFDGTDTAGCPCNGDVRLCYDSLRPGVATRLSGSGASLYSILPDLAEEKYTARFKARITSPLTRAYAFISDNFKIVKKVYIQGSVGDYAEVDISFDGVYCRPLAVGVAVDNDIECLFLESIKLYRMIDEQKFNQNIPSYTYSSFGDVDPEFCDNAVTIYSSGSLHKTYQLPLGVEGLSFKCEATNAKAEIYIYTPERTDFRLLCEGENEYVFNDLCGLIDIVIVNHTPDKNSKVVLKELRFLP